VQWTLLVINNIYLVQGQHKMPDLPATVLPTLTCVPCLSMFSDCKQLLTFPHVRLITIIKLFHSLNGA